MSGKKATLAHKSACPGQNNYKYISKKNTKQRSEKRKGRKKMRFTKTSNSPKKKKKYKKGQK